MGKVRYFNTGSYSMYEILGFTDTQVGNPGSPNYWKKIVPKDYDPINSRNSNDDQNWNDGSYYPVLPKFDERGKILGSLQSDDGVQRTPFGSPGRVWNEDDELAIITNDNIADDSLLIDVKMEFSEQNVMEDDSGNQNVAISISDFEINYDENFVPEKTKNIKDINIKTKDNSY